MATHVTRITPKFEMCKLVQKFIICIDHLQDYELLARGGGELAEAVVT